MKRDESLFIEDILDYIERIEKSVKNLTGKKFKSDNMLIDATVRRLEIIGEAAKNISDKTREKYPEIPWKDIAGFRDVIIHGYFKVDLNTVWKVIKDDLPKLKEKINKILKENKSR